MSKLFGRTAVLLMVLILALAPATTIFADSYSYYDSLYSLAYGHTGSAHYTSYSLRYAGTISKTTVWGYGIDHRLSLPGIVAYTEVVAPANAPHAHEYTSWT